MIISRAPTRISLGGGGTDLESYYSKFGGFLIAGAINKYCHILATPRFYQNYRLSYSEMEIRDCVEDIEHRIFKAALGMLKIERGIELHSTADVPAGCGLGTSSSFTVALLNALHCYNRDFVNQKQLAEEACNVEINLLGEPIGKQDQYMAAFGGLTCLTFEKNGDVIVEPLRVKDETIDQIRDNLILFFTGTERSASMILSDQVNRSEQNDSSIFENLHRIKEIGLQTRKYLENGEVDMLGELFHSHWELKRKRSSSISNVFIDECYEEARKHGAIGGKLIGAGGGGFLMFYLRNHSKLQLIKKMQQIGLKWVRFQFDFDGTRILVNT